MSQDLQERILTFWFGDLRSTGECTEDVKKRWWTKSPEFDAECRAQFQTELERASQGDFDHWSETPRGALALIILCDQLSRNMHRDTPKAFATDGIALKATLQLLETGMLDALHIQERAFACMPLMHSEDGDIQEASIAQFTALRDAGLDQLVFAEKHKVIIDRFGRYPHRNAILGRDSSPEEVAFLAGPDSSF